MEQLLTNKPCNEILVTENKNKNLDKNINKNINKNVVDTDSAFSSEMFKLKGEFEDLEMSLETTLFLLITNFVEDDLELKTLSKIATNLRGYNHSLGDLSIYKDIHFEHANKLLINVKEFIESITLLQPKNEGDSSFSELVSSLKDIFDKVADLEVTAKYMNTEDSLKVAKILNELCLSIQSKVNYFSQKAKTV